MATKALSAASVPHAAPTGTNMPVAEATGFLAGDTITFQNTGDVICRIVCTTPGTGSVQGVGGAASQPLTLALGNNFVGPLNPTRFGRTVTITTATAVGSVSTYLAVAPLANPLHSPFESNPAAADK